MATTTTTTRRARYGIVLPPWFSRAAAAVCILIAIVYPFLFTQGDSWVNVAVLAWAYAVMALGLNVMVGFAGLLDLGYLAFFAIGAYATGWFSSGFYADANIHVGAGNFASRLPGIHLNWLLVVILAMALCALAGVIIGLPTLRLRGDYIAIVTLAFGEIIRVFAVKGTDIHFGKDATLTAGRQGITPVDSIALPGGTPFNPLNLRTASRRSTHPASWASTTSPAPARSGRASGSSTGRRSRSSSSPRSARGACATRGSAARGSRSARTRWPPRRWASRWCAPS